MTLQDAAPLLAVLSGSLVGFTLGLIGGGGSILATPLLLYVVGLSPHLAIGTGAVAVSANAFANLWAHARAGHVRWSCAAQFSVVGALGAAAGSAAGRQLDGGRLIFLFALLMIAVGVLMLRRSHPGRAGIGAEPPAGPRALRHLIVVAFAVGALSGFFGIGGGFLIVPGLLYATRMPMICAIGSSLLAVGTFGLTTAVSYGLAGLVDWGVAGEYLVGGIAGGAAGMSLARRLAGRKAALDRIFAVLVFIVAAYMLYRNFDALRPMRP